MRARWLVLVLLVGCSFARVRGPKSRGVECTSGRAAPIADTILATGMAALAATGFVKDSQCDARRAANDSDAICLSMLYGLPAGVAAVTYMVSAMYGYTTVGTCQDFKRDHATDAR